ncbi:MAG TPA: TrbG/VirB9 family P-type conjugative transfer protein [Steroidobacteraceae bacterium]
MCAIPILGICAETPAASGAPDSRIRLATYSDDRVYRLVGYVGYQIDLEFESDESFLGLGAGDVEGLSFASQGNHLFLKPKASKVSTNITVLTNRREYHFDYTASTDHPDPREPDVTYVLRFSYARPPAPADPSARIERQLDEGIAQRSRNLDYWYCGTANLEPVSASDDGVHTRLRFGAHTELPAIFVRNDDGSESLLNFDMEKGEVVIHRVAHRFVLRRGLLRGCIVNKSFTGGGERLDSGTVAPSVERVTRGGRP